LEKTCSPVNLSIALRALYPLILRDEGFGLYSFVSAKRINDSRYSLRYLQDDYADLTSKRKLALVQLVSNARGVREVILESSLKVRHFGGTHRPMVVGTDFAGVVQRRDFVGKPAWGGGTGKG